MLFRLTYKLSRMIWIEQNRQLGDHPRIFPFHTRNSEPSPVVTDNAAADAETKSRPPVRRFCGEEGILHPLDDGSGNSGAMVAKRNTHVWASVKDHTF